MARARKRSSKKLRKNPPPLVTDGKLYHVEVIKAVRWSSELQALEYLIQWSGWEGYNTWEPYDCVKHCDRLLASMWAMIGVDDVDRRKTTLLPKDWIDSEVAYFREYHGHRPETKNKGWVPDTGRLEQRLGLLSDEEASKDDGEKEDDGESEVEERGSSDTSSDG